MRHLKCFELRMKAINWCKQIANIAEYYRRFFSLDYPHLLCAMCARGLNILCTAGLQDGIFGRPQEYLIDMILSYENGRACLVSRM